MPISDETSRWVAGEFEQSILPALTEYAKIPNKSPLFERHWRETGHMERAVTLLTGWARERLPQGATLEVVRLGERTPLILIDVPATDGGRGGNVLFYGHLDKQPEMTGWREGLGPWTPVREGDKLYGRGVADDGYALFAALTAINAAERDGLPHARCLVVIEACEESGSTDLPAYVEHLEARLGQLSLVICLDSGCANYDALWATTSLRGGVFGTLEVSLLKEGVHSGDGTGIVAPSERVIRVLLDRLEDSVTGRTLLPELECPIPEQRRQQAERTARMLGAEVWNKFPLQPGVEPVSNDPTELVLNRTWRPGLAITSAEGWPPLESAGNVLRPFTKLTLSLRLPPRVDPDAAARAMKAALESRPPYGAKVTFTLTVAMAGWDAPELAPWLERALEQASRRHFGSPAYYMGEGGGIPFMQMLGRKFPEAQFAVTGVLGPGSNAHGPNEFLHVPTAKKLTSSIADVLAAHSAR
ncbi:MAG TPA: M20/M25/M40 family metallo-hydrolase [Polyangiaceae bacterium]|nr:M20/M25/M40 family metallo-hydrolase [Polyangiaceae bacterium]